LSDLSSYQGIFCFDLLLPSQWARCAQINLAHQVDHENSWKFMRPGTTDHSPSGFERLDSAALASHLPS
jgi:hypothetical protein